MPADWRLSQAVFQEVTDIWLVDTDLFAAAWNKTEMKLPTFVSWRPQPGAWTTNAFAPEEFPRQGLAFWYGDFETPPSKLMNQPGTIDVVCVLNGKKIPCRRL
jgi:hypothetical protein